MKILIIGNEGYIGPVLLDHLKKSGQNYFVGGYDIGYFSHVITTDSLPEKLIDLQYRGDVRSFSPEVLKSFDSVVYLAAISNDPMGKEFEKITYDVNQHAAIKIAKSCIKAGVKNFVYASSCSVYGEGGNKPKKEESKLNPLTAYAKSKINTEKELEALNSTNCVITCLRFATACGFSPRIRLDLVLNDFVASAITSGTINILSDGSPWRPLIHVKDMARAIEWALNRNEQIGGQFLVLNAGSNQWNYQVKELASYVKEIFGKVKVNINKSAEPDKRSYKVDFSKFEKLAFDYKPKVTIEKAINDLLLGLREYSGLVANFRDSKEIRLNVLRSHLNKDLLKSDLSWSK